MRHEPGFYVFIGEGRGPCADGLARVSAYTSAEDVVRVFRGSITDRAGLALIVFDAEGHRHALAAFVESIEESVGKSGGLHWNAIVILPPRPGRPDPVRVRFPAVDIPIALRERFNDGRWS